MIIPVFVHVELAHELLLYVMSVYDTLVLDKFFEGSGHIELLIANICDIRPNCKILVALIEVKLAGMILNVIVYD